MKTIVAPACGCAHNAHMARHVTAPGTARCTGCLIPMRWCACHGMVPLQPKLDLQILFHPDELAKPTSSGLLLSRLIPICHRQIFDPRQPPQPEAFLRSGRELWILHPDARSPDAPLPPPESVSVLLIDGAWKQAGRMLDSLRGVGRRVSLPISGESRYWLRSLQPQAGRCSTLEAAAACLRLLGEHELSEDLLLRFELHVLQNLRARGRKPLAEAYLESSSFGRRLAELVYACEERFERSRAAEC